MILLQIQDQLPHLSNLGGIQTHRRLVQDQDFGISQQRLGKAYTLLIALGQVPDQPVLHIRQLQPLHSLVDLGFHVLPLDSLDPSHEPQIFLHPHIQIQGRQLRQIADALFDLLRLLGDVKAVHHNRSGGGGQIAGDHIHGSGLSRPIWPQESKDLSVLHRKGKIFYRRYIAIEPCQVFDFNHSNSPFKIVHAAGCRVRASGCSVDFTRLQGKKAAETFLIIIAKIYVHVMNML